MFTLDCFAETLAAESRVLLAPRRRGTRAHAWSPLGGFVADRYSMKSGGRRLATPIPLTVSKFAEHPILRSLLLPYGSGRPSLVPSRRSVYFLCTDLMNIRGPQPRSRDPRYVLQATIQDPLERMIVRVLKRDGFSDYEHLARETSSQRDLGTMRAALARLLRAGVVLQSDAMRDE
jgi:hypothetical protein